MISIISVVGATQNPLWVREDQRKALYLLKELIILRGKKYQKEVEPRYLRESSQLERTAQGNGCIPDLLHHHSARFDKYPGCANFYLCKIHVTLGCCYYVPGFLDLILTTYQKSAELPWPIII